MEALIRALINAVRVASPSAIKSAGTAPAADHARVQPGQGHRLNLGGGLEENLRSKRARSVTGLAPRGNA
jgi:hypothetical protein